MTQDTIRTALAPELSADEQFVVPASWYRGGTSKLFIVERSDVGTLSEEQLTSWILGLFGSPDSRQIDGVGGADQVTSKFALIGAPTKPQTDLDYTFCQVGIDTPVVSNDLNCGNVTAAVALYALDRGYVAPADGQVVVRIHNTNDGATFYANLEVRDGHAVRTGDFVCDGVPGSGAPIGLDLREAVGGRTGKLLPTGNERDRFEVPGYGIIETTVVDIANLIAFAPASAFGLSGNENPDELQSKPGLRAAVEHLRGAVAHTLGLARSAESAAQDAPATPFVSLVSAPQDWTTYGYRVGRSADECDIMARGYSLGAFTKAYWGTGTVTTGVAALLPDTVVHDLVRSSARATGRVRVAHPSGTNEVEVEIGADEASGDTRVDRARLFRTARKIMDGLVYVPIERVGSLTVGN